MQRQQKIILIAGVALAGIALLLVNAYLEQRQRQIAADARRQLEAARANSVSVLVASKDIPQGATIEVDSIAPKIVPKEYVQPDAVTSADRIAGMVAIAPISKDEQISLNKLTTIRDIDSLSATTAIGKRAITITVDNVSSLAGMLSPGDHVDVIAMIPVPVQTPDGKVATSAGVVPLFQDVTVLAVGRETRGTKKSQSRGRKEEKKEEISSLVTIALSPEEANIISFVQEQGKIRLVLRNPGDAQIQTTFQPANWDSVLQYVMPQALIKPEPKKEEEPKAVVEIYRGMNREKVILEK